jgi:hypothetical protein
MTKQRQLQKAVKFKAKSANILVLRSVLRDGQFGQADDGDIDYELPVGEPVSRDERQPRAVAQRGRRRARVLPESALCRIWAGRWKTPLW